MFIYWKQIYVGSFNTKLLFANIWRQNPKFICWGIWLVRNKAIFQNKSLPPQQILALVCGLLLEFFSNKNQVPDNKAPLTDLE
jgi:hypothetical protein